MKRKYIFSPAILGILFMILSQFSFSLNDSLVKLIVIESSNQLSLLNTIFIRGLFTTLVILLYIKIVERKNLITIVSQIPYHKRGLYEVLTAICFLSGLILLPFAEVYTLLMTNPLFVTIFAFLFLKEKVGVRRWIAITVGFIGVLIVINPNKVDFNFLYILPIMAAIFLTIRDIKTKNIANDNNSFEIIFITSLLMTVFSGFGSLFSEFSLEFKSLFKIILASIFLSIAYLLSVLTVFYAPLSLTSSARYSVIIFGIFFGYIFFDELPTINMIIGALFIIFSGLFVIQRERKLGKTK
jgi:drug/metabolite transporter (DMT)-like permease|tara:strand:- start:246 stop:1139 length:894 start_codon:yes stop_codon:yes gene_type:complete